MFPVLFASEYLVIPTFFSMVTLGILVITFYLYFRAPSLGLSQIVVLDLGIVGAIFGILGARVFHILVEALDFYREDWTRIFEFWRGGFVSYGAFIGGGGAVLLYLILRHQPMLKYADLVATGLPILVFFIRLGCLGVGCCYGKPTDFFFHLTFHNPYTPPAEVGLLGQHLHATQVYGMLKAVFIFGFLNWYYRRRRFDGEVMCLFFMIYPVLRALIEFLRGDLDRGVYLDGAVSTAQITGLVIFVVAAMGYAYLWNRHKSQLMNVNSDQTGPRLKK